MKISHIWSSIEASEILQTTDLSQCAVIRLGAGGSTSEKPNRHPKSDQTVLMLYGEIELEINGEKHIMRRGECVVIERDLPHRLRNSGAEEAVAFTVYSPPAYADS